ncbi:MAG: hypothetical protein ACREQA_02945 [Candidatus Binatia bacterium]
MKKRKARVCEQELIEIATPYWEAEAEIARRFFRKRPTKDDHIFWLRAQLWKELHPVDGYFSGLHRELVNLADMFPRVDQDVDRHHYHFLLEQMVQEFNHYLLQADILEYLLGRKISPQDTVQLPEERRLGEMRRRYTSSGSEIDKAAVLITEGGGARLFKEGRKVRGGLLEEKIAKAMDVIFKDEKDHFKEAAKQAAKAVKSEGDLARMEKAIREISLQRVRMRNEMFKKPLSEDELNNFILKHGTRY